MKKIKSYNNFKNIETTNNKEEIHYNFENIIKKYKNSALSVKLNNSNANKNITDLKNFSNNSGSNTSSFLALNTLSNHRNKIKKIIYKKIAYTDERIKYFKTPYMSKSNPKERKIKEYYKIYNPYNKINIISRRHNNNKILKTLCNTSYISNNIIYKDYFILNKPNKISVNNTKILNNIKHNKKYKNSFIRTFISSNNSNSNTSHIHNL